MGSPPAARPRPWRRPPLRRRRPPRPRRPPHRWRHRPPQPRPRRRQPPRQPPRQRLRQRLRPRRPPRGHSLLHNPGSSRAWCSGPMGVDSPGYACGSGGDRPRVASSPQRPRTVGFPSPTAKEHSPSSSTYPTPRRTSGGTAKTARAASRLSASGRPCFAWTAGTPPKSRYGFRFTPSNSLPPCPQTPPPRCRYLTPRPLRPPHQGQGLRPGPRRHRYRSRCTRKSCSWATCPPAARLPTARKCKTWWRTSLKRTGCKHQRSAWWSASMSRPSAQSTMILGQGTPERSARVCGSPGSGETSMRCSSPEPP